MKIRSVNEVLVPVEVVLGGTELTAAEISELDSGSIVKLESLAGEPVTLMAGETRIARGEVVVIDENFGIRLTKIVEEEGRDGRV